MRRAQLTVVLSHCLVAAAAVVVSAVVARLVFASIVGSSASEGQPESSRADVVAVVESALTVGALAGCVVAVTAGCLAGHRIVASRLTSRATRNAARLEAARAPGEVAPGEVSPQGAAGEAVHAVSDLNRLQAALADTETRRRRLLGEVAHEMRTPLTIIDGYVEGMIDGIIARDAEELSHVTDEVRRLRRLADDLSALSRAEEGRLELRPLLLDLRGVVVTAAERLRPQVEDAELTMEVVPGEHLVPVAVDQDRLSQVVRNLVGNAVRATEAAGRVEVRVGRAGRWAWFCVTDTGEGIDPADLERIFERFYRVAGRRGARRETGSGIGLTIAREIVRAHGGELVARSPGRGGGAEFIGWLPAAH